MFGTLKIGKIASDVADAFCAELPRDRLTEKETILFNLLQEVAAAVESLLPPGVSLQDWAERRIPESQATSANASRMVYAGHAAAVDYSANFARSETTQPAVRVGQPQQEPPNQHGKMTLRPSEIPKNVGSARLPWRAKMDSTVSADAFFDSLPADSFLPWEMQLSELLTKAFNSHRRHRSSGNPKLLTAFMEHPQSAPVIKENLPASVSFEDWILKRVGGEYDVQVDNNGNKIITKIQQHLTEEEQEARMEERAQQADEFFASLPQDSFCEEEVALREAIFAFIDAWSGTTPPTTSDLGSNKAVQAAKVALLPSGISIKRWCESRIAAEVEFLQGDGDGSLVAIGYPGQWDSKQILQMTLAKKKRKL